MPTNFEADHHDPYRDQKTTFHTHDTIMGTGDFDTRRQAALLKTSEHDERTIYLEVLNLPDRARVCLDRGVDPPPMPKPLKATLNDELIDIASIKRHDMVEVTEGQVFRIWFGDGTWEERDEMLGSAEVTWTPR